MSLFDSWSTVTHASPIRPTHRRRNPEVRRTLVKAIDAERPAFIAITGDISYNGGDPNDWKVWDAETAVWRKDGIPIYPQSRTARQY